MDSIYLSAAFQEGEAPKEIRLFKAGLNETTKGEFLFDEVAANSVLEAYKSCPTYPELMFDFGHDSLKQSGSKDRHEAAGWFRLELRDEELWATEINWVSEIAEKIKNKKYKFYSPAFTPSQEEPKRPLRIINCAITNLPATIGLSPLMASEMENNQNMLPKLAEMLGLDPATCTEADVMSALSTMQKEMADMKAKNEAPLSSKEPALPMADPMKCSEVDEVIALSGIADKADWKNAIVVLSSEVKNLRLEKQTNKVAAVVEDAIKARKLAPAQRNSHIKLGMKDLEMLSEILANATPVLPEVSNQPETKEIISLSEEDKKIAYNTGVSEEAFAATKKLQESKQGNK